MFRIAIFFFSYILIQIVTNNLVAQNFCLKIVPNISSPFGTYRQKIEESPENNIQIIPIFGFGNINWSSLNYSMEAYFLMINRLEIGSLISTTKVQNGLRMYYFSEPSSFQIPFNPSGSFLEYGLSTTNARIDYGLSFKYSINKVGNKNNSRLFTQLIFQPTFSTNKSTNEEGTLKYFSVSDGYLLLKDSVSNKISNKIGYALNFKLETTFHNKKNQEVLNFYIGYRQGINVVNQHVFYVEHTNGMSARVNSKSFSSALLAGISKTINIIR